MRLFLADFGDGADFFKRKEERRKRKDLFFAKLVRFQKGFCWICVRFSLADFGDSGDFF